MKNKMIMIGEILEAVMTAIGIALLQAQPC